MPGGTKITPRIVTLKSVFKPFSARCFITDRGSTTKNFRDSINVSRYDLPRPRRIHSSDIWEIRRGSPRARHESCSIRSGDLRSSKRIICYLTRSARINDILERAINTYYDLMGLQKNIVLLASSAEQMFDRSAIRIEREKMYRPDRKHSGRASGRTK